MNVVKNKSPYMLVELANCHGGNRDALIKNIAAYGEVDYSRKGIKFQVIDPDLISLPDFEWYPVYKNLHFDAFTWAEMIKLASSFGDVWIDVFDRYGVDIIKSNIDHIYGFKLQASVLENYEIYQELLSIELTSKFLIINVSGFELGDIDRLVERLSQLSQNVIIQIGFQAYPTAVVDTALQKISILSASYPNLDICFADHANATDEFSLLVPVYATLLGCEYIEKHFCYDRSEAVYDEFSAIEPKQMARLCQLLDEAALASSGGFIEKAEQHYLEKTIQIPVISHHVSSGKLLSLSDLKFRRTAKTGFSWQQVLKHQKTRHILSVDLDIDDAIDASVFRKAKVAVIVAGRMKSTRLKKKAILPIGEMASVERCLTQCLSLESVDQIILATSNLEEDAILGNYLVGGQVKLWRGEPDDVISRYIGASDNFGVDVVVRVTADCPFVLPEIIEFLLDSHFETGADYTVAKEFSVGTSAEIINVEALRKIKSYFQVAEYSEYMTWYFQNNPEFFKLNYVSLPEKYVRDYRVTLDYPEDLSMFEAVTQHCEKPNEVISADELFSILDSNPEIPELNSHLELKYKVDRKLIEELNNKTRIRIER